MAGLLVAIGIMSILMAAAMPAWRTLAKREKEAELLFRGRQYVRAVELYQRRFPGAYPTDLQALVDEGFLRRLYLDPVTGEPFRILTQGSAAAAAGEAAAGGDDAGDGGPERRFGGAGRNPFGVEGSRPGGRGGRLAPGPFSGAMGDADEELGGIVGVVSRSTDESLLEFNGATRYDQWLFVHQAQAVTSGASAAGIPGLGASGAGPGASGVGGAAEWSGRGGLSRRPADGGFAGDFGRGREPGGRRGR